ncbi:hypothetical protein SEUCBS140593_006694 [Sporothrix eucalyptigena]|uniref:Uncharacterized protein n=1 Tax=Sporothrix eucalyptigena TaxID=1812306 RepID=A0ABP0C6Z3_9PEZI
MAANKKKMPYDVILDDQLEPTYVPRVSKAAQEAANEMAETHCDDDISDRLRDDSRYLKNANRDIVRLLANARRIYAENPDAPLLLPGHKMVNDHAGPGTTHKFEYKNPRPMTLAQGQDGGVNICIYQQRRVRPGEDDPVSIKKTVFPFSRIAPRHQVDKGTACVGVMPNEFTVRRPPRKGAVAANVVRVIKKKTTTAASKRKNWLQRKLAEYLLRQPAKLPSMPLCVTSEGQHGRRRDEAIQGGMSRQVEEDIIMLFLA